MSVSYVSVLICSECTDSTADFHFYSFVNASSSSLFILKYHISSSYTEHLKTQVDDVFSNYRHYHSQFLFRTTQRVAWKEVQFKYCFDRAWKFVI